MKLGMAEKIRIHQQREEEAVELAQSYARTGHYSDAARSYQDAEFHQAMVAELKSVKR